MFDTTSTPARLPRHCAPWCEIRTLGIDPAEHPEVCVSPALAAVKTESTQGHRFDVYSAVGRYPERIHSDYVRLDLDPAGTHDGAQLLLPSGKARSMAAGLLAAADVVDGLRTFPHLAAAQPLHHAARDLDALADTLPEDAARRVREQARELRMQGVSLA